MARRERPRVVAEEKGFWVEARGDRYFFGIPPGKRKEGLTADELAIVARLCEAAGRDYARQPRFPEGT